MYYPCNYAPDLNLITLPQLFENYSLTPSAFFLSYYSNGIVSS
jgi:hypothetical protein